MWKRRCSKGVYVCVHSVVWDSQLVCFVPHTLQYVQVLKVLLRSYQDLETPDYISVCQVHACQIHKHTSFPPSPPSFPPSLPLPSLLSSLSPSLPLSLSPFLPLSFPPFSLLSSLLPPSLPPSLSTSYPPSPFSLPPFFPPSFLPFLSSSLLSLTISLLSPSAISSWTTLLEQPKY